MKKAQKKAFLGKIYSDLKNSSQRQIYPNLYPNSAFKCSKACGFVSENSVDWSNFDAS